MKILKLLSLIFALSWCMTACDDDDDNTGENPSGGVTTTKVTVAFEKEGITTLKNAGTVQVPLILSEAPAADVKVVVGTQESTTSTAEEGIDFEIKDKVIVVEKGSTVANVEVELLNDGKVSKDKTFGLEIKNVYGDGKKADAKQVCQIGITSNAFVEFQYEKREVKEGAGTYLVPLLIQGEIKEATTVKVRVKEGGTALEGTHFSIEQPELTLEKDAAAAAVKITLVDDNIANEDRWFDLEVVEINGSNATIGHSNPVCRITIVSEEVLKYASFAATEMNIEEGKTLYVPVILDKAPVDGEPAVTVTVSVKAGEGDAQEDNQFTITEKVLTFAPGQKEELVEIRTTDDEVINADRYFILTFKAATGSNIGTPDVCKVVINNNDFPYFNSLSYVSVESSGSNMIPVNIPVAYDYDVTLDISSIAETAVEGTHYTLTSQQVTIPAGQTKAYIYFDVQHALDWTEAPAFKIKVDGANGVSFTREVVTTITLQPCAYRKLLGTWSLACTPNNTAASCDVVITGGDSEEERAANWEKQVKCVAKGFMWSQHDVTFTFTYEAGQLKLVLNQRCEAHNWNYGSDDRNNVVLRYALASNINATELAVNYDQENLVITYPEEIGGLGYQGNSTLVNGLWGFLQTNTVLTKQ